MTFKKKIPIPKNVITVNTFTVITIKKYIILLRAQFDFSFVFLPGQSDPISQKQAIYFQNQKEKFIYFA